MSYIDPQTQTDLNNLSANPGLEFSQGGGTVGGVGITFKTRNSLRAAKQQFTGNIGIPFPYLTSGQQSTLITDATALATS
jgi:hypothetical protein